MDPGFKNYGDGVLVLDEGMHDMSAEKALLQVVMLRRQKQVFPTWVDRTASPVHPEYTHDPVPWPRQCCVLSGISRLPATSANM